MEEYDPSAIVWIPCHVALRRRPSMYLGELKSERSLQIVRHLLLYLQDEYPRAERAEERDAFLTLEGNETVRLFGPGFPLTPVQLIRDMRSLSAPGSAGLTFATAFSSSIQVDLWRDGRHWRVHGVNGFIVTCAREVRPAEPIPTHAARGLRVECHLDPTFFGRRAPSPKQLRQRVADFTAGEPALRVHFASPD